MNAVVKEHENQIVEFDEFEIKLQEFKKKYDDVVYDLTIPEQDKQARSDKHAIGKIISSLDSKHKELKAPLKIRTDLIDGRRKEIKDQLLDVQGKIKGQIEAHENAIEEHAEKLQLMVDEIYSLTDFGQFEPPTLQLIESSLRIANEVMIDDSYEDRKADATLAQVQVVKELNTLLEIRTKQEQEQAELEKLRKEKEERERAEREEQIRKEAAEKATREAEEVARQATLDAEAATKRAEDEAAKVKKNAELAAEIAKQNKIQAKKDAADQAEAAANAERLKIEREQKEKEERELVEKGFEDAKKAKQAHRNKIEKQAVDSLVANECNQEMAELIVSIIVEGGIKNITINY